jgi:hypothetical protein
MEIKKKKLLGLPSWGLALLAAIVFSIFLIVIASLVGSILPIDENIGEGIAYSLYGVAIAVACFFICKHNPKSVWYVPIIANILGILSAIVEPSFWISDLWILIGFGWILSIVASIIGRIVGQKRYELS